MNNIVSYPVDKLLQSIPSVKFRYNYKPSQKSFRITVDISKNTKLGTSNFVTKKYYLNEYVFFQIK